MSDRASKAGNGNEDPRDARGIEPRGRGPGRPRVLSEGEIVDAAIEIARELGIADLSMRAVARKLDVPPMTIYGYVANKDALHALVTDRILSDVHVPAPEEGPWDVRLRVLLCDARRVLVERPQLTEGRSSIGGSAVELLHRGAFGREGLRLVETVYALLHEGGFRLEHADVCFGALFTYVTGLTDPTGTGELGAGASSSPSAPTSAEIFARGLEALIEGLKLLRDAAEPEVAR